MDILLYVAGGIVALFALIAFILFVYITLQGEGDVKILVKERSPLACEYIDDQKAVFSMTVPFYNGGRQEDIILDAFARILLPQEQFDLAKATGLLENSTRRRNDNYMEAFIIKVKEKGDFVLTLEFEAIDSNMQEVLENIVDVTIDLYWSAVGRKAPRFYKEDLTILLEEFQDSARSKGGTN